MIVILLDKETVIDFPLLKKKMGEKRKTIMKYNEKAHKRIN